MKRNMPVLILVAMLAAAVAITLAGCAEEPDEVTGEMMEQAPEAAEEVFTEEPPEPGQEETPGLEVEEMEEETPPHVEDGETEEDTEMDETTPEPPPAPDAGE